MGYRNPHLHSVWPPKETGKAPLFRTPQPNRNRGTTTGQTEPRSRQSSLLRVLRFFVMLCPCETPLFRYALRLREPRYFVTLCACEHPAFSLCLALARPRFFVMLCPCGRPRSPVMLCPCVSEVPFGRKMRGVDVFSVDYVMVCGFRIGVGAKRNGGWGARSFLRARFWGEQNFYGCNDFGESEL